MELGFFSPFVCFPACSLQVNVISRTFSSLTFNLVRCELSLSPRNEHEQTNRDREMKNVKAEMAKKLVQNDAECA